ncbi:MAG: DNA repair protein RadA [Acidimicrobiales bacterium]
MPTNEFVDNRFACDDCGTAVSAFVGRDGNRLDTTVSLRALPTPSPVEAGRPRFEPASIRRGEGDLTVSWAAVDAWYVVVGPGGHRGVEGATVLDGAALAAGTPVTLRALGPGVGRPSTSTSPDPDTPPPYGDAMSRAKTVHRCTACGAEQPRWSGRCGSCAAWHTLVEELPAVRAPAVGSVGPLAVPLAEVDDCPLPVMPTGVGELDRVLGGGLVAGSVTLVAGEPGIGKSTLLLQAAMRRAQVGASVLYVSAEERAGQVRDRAARLGPVPPTLWLTAQTSLAAILAAIEEVAAQVVVVDSIQTIADPELGSGVGSVVQVRECAARLVRAAKDTGFCCLLVGHVTKDGAIAGPRTLEHIVDTVVSVEGDRHHGLRLLRAVKHRFGPTGEVGILELAAEGMRAVPDASALLLADRSPHAPGSIVAPVLEGRRPILVELQALVAPAAGPPSVRALGSDTGRLSVLLGVLRRRAGLPLGRNDVVTSVAGGVRLADPGADLGFCLAVASAALDRPVPATAVAIAEVGLAGELRLAAQTPRRLAEAARLGFEAAFVPPSAPSVAGIELRRAATVAEVLAQVGLGPSGESAGRRSHRLAVLPGAPRRAG